MILSNQVLCHNCGEAPWSAHRHDFVQCGCLTSNLQVAVDGGQDYLRRVAGKDANYADISIVIDEVHLKGLEAAIADKTRNDLGKVCNLARYLRDEMDINITPQLGEDEDG